jgi:hypothetical protein
MKVIDIIKSIAHDTLKKDVNGVREWDRMKLTMFVSFVWCIIIATLDYIQYGWRSEAWLILIGFAFGSKIIDAQAKRIEK